jgi:hypothetical protein
VEDVMNDLSVQSSYEMPTSDRDFLIWIHSRLEMYGDGPLLDFMHKLRAIIAATPALQFTENKGQGCNNLSELVQTLVVVPRTMAKVSVGLYGKIEIMPLEEARNRNYHILETFDWTPSVTVEINQT